MKPITTATVFDKRGRVLAVAQNSYVKTHPLQASLAKQVGQPHRIYLHAEVAALLKCDWKKVGSMLVARYNREGKPMNATPCPVCQSLINKIGVKNVWHT